MRRREFVASVGALAAWPFETRAQSQPLPRLGLLLANRGPARATILRSLEARGYVHGRSILIEERHAEGELERLPALAQELVSLPVDVIVAVAASATIAARQATRTIPIVMVHAGDPVGHGLIESLARPGGNVTGTTSHVPEIVGKAVTILHELVPGITRLTLLVVPSNSGAALSVQQARLAASHLGVDLTVVGIERAAELPAAFETIVRSRADALVVAGEPMLLTNRLLLFEFADSARLPTMYMLTEFVRDGGLIGYGFVAAEHHQLVGEYVHKILTGAKPAELPVAQSTRFALHINLNTAKKLGISPPPALLARADEVIE
ncbi:MAG TPA: ABC transporter substrate-binding protein [Beijerinckiaceae bacterium]|nr:ABC transporter substrate-binding protein [Beijerinckiaceae bacterium]